MGWPMASAVRNGRCEGPAGKPDRAFARSRLGKPTRDLDELASTECAGVNIARRLLEINHFVVESVAAVIENKTYPSRVSGFDRMNGELGTEHGRAAASVLVGGSSLEGPADQAARGGRVLVAGLVDPSVLWVGSACSPAGGCRRAGRAAGVGEVDGALALAGRRPLVAPGRPVRGPVHGSARLPGGAVAVQDRRDRRG
jgi:hypothetical protein